MQKITQEQKFYLNGIGIIREKRFASINKAEAKLGFKAEVILNDGIKQTIEWTRLNMTVIEQNISKHEEHMKRL